MSHTENRPPSHSLPAALAAGVIVLCAEGAVIMLLNWAWAFRHSMHARSLLAMFVLMGAVSGATAGLFAGLLWRFGLPAMTRRAVPPVAFVAGLGIIGPIAVLAFLKAARLMGGLPYDRVLAAILLLALLVFSGWISIKIGRKTAGLVRSGLVVAVAVSILAATAAGTAWYAWAGPDPTKPRSAPPPTPSAARADDDAPDIILISLDTVRPDHLSAFGYHRPTSPNIDGLIRQGALFPETISSSSWTIPAHATLLTGASPSRIGPSLLETGASGALFVPPEAVTLPEILRSKGYATAAFISSAAMRSSFGFDQGFDYFDEIWPPSIQAATSRMLVAEDVRYLLNRDRVHYLESLNPLLISISNSILRQGHLPDFAGFLEHTSNPQRMWNAAEEVNAKVERYLSDLPAGPHFLFVHYFDAHSPFDAPAPFSGRWGRDRAAGYIMDNHLLHEVMGNGKKLTAEEAAELVDLYDEELGYLDAQVGSLMEALRASGLLENAIVVLFSDHGESLGEHGKLFHGHALTEELIRIVFSISYPGVIAPGTRIDGQVRAVDIMPTLLDIAGIRHDPGAEPEGISLAPFLTGGRTRLPDARAAYSEVLSGGMAGMEYGAFERSYLSIRQDGWKLVVRSGGDPELFDLGTDPGELQDLAGQRPELAQELRQRLEAWRAVGFTRSDHTDVDPDRIEQLRSLGYVGGAD